MNEKTDSQRLKALEEMVAEIYAHVVMGQTATPGEAEYRRALEAMWEGDMMPLRRYLQRGGKIPKPETVYPTSGRAVRQQGRKHAATKPLLHPECKPADHTSPEGAISGPVQALR